MTYVPDRGSAEWQSLKAWLSEELDTYYKRLAGLDSTEKETEQHRGAVAFINKLLSLENRPVTSRR